MSVDATRWAWSVEVTSATKRLVLLALADRAGEEHTCYPSAKRMVKDTKLNRKTILNAITDLISDGLVFDTGQRKGNGVRVLKLVGVSGRENEISLDFTTDPKIDTSTKIDTTTDPEIGTTTDPKIGTQNLKGNLKKNLTNITLMGKALKEKNADDKLISEWVEIRRKLKATDSERAVNMFFKQVENSGCDLNTILNICVTKTWKGFEASYLRSININDYAFISEIQDEVKTEQPIKIVKTKRSYI